MPPKGDGVLPAGEAGIGPDNAIELCLETGTGSALTSIIGKPPGRGRASIMTGPLASEAYARRPFVTGLVLPWVSLAIFMPLIRLKARGSLPSAASTSAITSSGTSNDAGGDEMTDTPGLSASSLWIEDGAAEVSRDRSGVDKRMVPMR